MIGQKKIRQKNSQKVSSKNSSNYSTKKIHLKLCLGLRSSARPQADGELKRSDNFFKVSLKRFFSFLYLSVYVVRVVLHKKYIWFMTYLTSWMQPICFTFFESKVRLKKSCEKALFLIQNLRIWVHEYLLLFIIVEFSLAFVQKYCYEYFSFVT